MALENLVGADKFLSALVPTNPVGADDKREGDDHIRGLKNTLRNTFPNLNAAVTSTPAELSAVGATADQLAALLAAMQFFQGAWVPVLYIGGVAQAGWNTSYARYTRIGELIFLACSMQKDPTAYSGAGSVTLRGLPFPPLTGGVGNISYFSSYVPAGEIHLLMTGDTVQFSKGANRTVDVTNADLVNGPGILTFDGFYRHTPA
jgi:hypothetical protein